MKHQQHWSKLISLPKYQTKLFLLRYGDWLSRWRTQCFAQLSILHSSLLFNNQFSRTSSSRLHVSLCDTCLNVVAWMLSYLINILNILQLFSLLTFKVYCSYILLQVNRTFLIIAIIICFSNIIFFHFLKLFLLLWNSQSFQCILFNLWSSCRFPTLPPFNNFKISYFSLCL